METVTTQAPETQFSLLVLVEGKEEEEGRVKIDLCHSLLLLLRICRRQGRGGQGRGGGSGGRGELSSQGSKLSRHAGVEQVPLCFYSPAVQMRQPP